MESSHHNGQMLEDSRLDSLVRKPGRSIGEAIDLQRESGCSLGQSRNEASVGLSVTDVRGSVKIQLHISAEDAEIRLDTAVGQSVGIIHILHLAGTPLLDFLLNPLLEQRDAGVSGEHVIVGG